MPWRASSLSFVAQNANQPLDNSHSIRTPVAFRSHAGRIPVAVGRYDAHNSSTTGGRRRTEDCAMSFLPSCGETVRLLSSPQPSHATGA